jgi:hypothetical protein
LSGIFASRYKILLIACLQLVIYDNTRLVKEGKHEFISRMRRIKAVNCTTLINPTNRTIVFDVGWQAIPETIVFNLILFLVSTVRFIRCESEGFTYHD